MRLTPEEIANHKARLADWHSPSEMLAVVEALMHQLGSKDMFNQSGLEFIRDAWLAATFAGKRCAEAVQLVAEDRPDFYLRLATGDIEAFEAVEADEEGRKRGLEYRNAKPGKDLAIEQWATPEEAFEAIRAAAEKKAKRAAELAAAGTPYPPDTGLLIYLNLQDIGAHQQEIESVFASAVEPAVSCFPSIWILWKEQAYRASAAFNPPPAS